MSSYIPITDFAAKDLLPISPEKVAKGSDLQAELNAIAEAIASKADTLNPTFTGTVTLPASTSIGPVSAVEIGYLDGVTSAIQAQLNAKQASIEDLQDQIDEIAASAGVVSFNGRDGLVTLTSGDVTGALSFTPANVSHNHAGVYLPLTGGTITGNLEVSSNVVAGNFVYGLGGSVEAGGNSFVGSPGLWLENTSRRGGLHLSGTTIGLWDATAGAWRWETNEAGTLTVYGTVAATNVTAANTVTSLGLTTLWNSGYAWHGFQSAAGASTIGDWLVGRDGGTGAFTWLRWNGASYDQRLELSAAGALSVAGAGSFGGGLTVGGDFAVNVGYIPGLRSAASGNHNEHIDASGNASTYINWFQGTGGLIVGAGNSSGVLFQVDGSGNATATGNVTAYSDARVKENVRDFTLTPEQLAALRLVEYDRTDLGRHEIGVIAQEVEGVAPWCVVTDNNGRKSVDYGRLAVSVALSQRTVH